MTAFRLSPFGVPATVHLADTRDADDQAALLGGWNQTYAQMSPGHFHGHIEEVRVADVHLFVEGTSRGLLQRGALAAHRLAVGVPLDPGHGPAVFCGAATWTSRFCTFSGGEGFEFFTPEGLSMAGLALDEAALMALATPEEQEVLHRVGMHAGLHEAADSSLQGLRQFMVGAFEMIRSADGLMDSAAVAHALHCAARSNVLDLLLSSDLGEGAVSPHRQWHLVTQARELVQAHPDTPLTVADLCATLKVSRRTLQSSFQHVLGMAPATFLRAVRLAGARRALRDSASVTDAAAQWGFWHFSHFAHDYRSMFGELPSQTWRRQHASEMH